MATYAPLSHPAFVKPGQQPPASSPHLCPPSPPLDAQENGSCAALGSPPPALPGAACASTSRLAAVNQFERNPDEPRRGLQELVHALMEELGPDKKGPKDLNRLWNLMMSYDASGNEWKRYEFWDDKKKYTRNLIAQEDGCFALMLLCWNPRTISPIHNHAGSECFLSILTGQIVERQYVVKGGEGDSGAAPTFDPSKAVCSNIPPSELTQTHEETYSAGSCTFMNDSLGVHSVENPFDERAVSLHCYIPGYSECTSYWEDKQAHCFKAQQSFISFDTEQGEKTHQ